MDDPELREDERLLIRSNGVHVKSISFEAILTNKRIILVDRIKKILPPKEIPLSTIQSVEAGENAIRDSIISLEVLTKTGEMRQMVLTFSRDGGGNRAKERNEWIRRIKESTNPSFEQVMRTVIPGMPPEGQQMPPQYANQGSPVPPAQYYAPPQRSPEPEPQRYETYQPVQPQPQAPAAQPQPVLGTYCTKCGTRVPEGSGFCNKCGTRIVIPGATPQVPVNQPVYAPAPAPAQYAASPRPIDQDVRTIEPLMERSAERVPADPLRQPSPNVVGEKRYEITDSRMTAPAGQPSRAAKPEVQAAPEQKKRFVPRLFSPKDLPPTPLVPKSMPAGGSRPPKPAKPRNRKKIFLAVGIIVIILIAVVGAVVLLPKLGSLTATSTSSGSSTGSTPTVAVTSTSSSSSSGSSTSVVVSTRTPVAIPATGVYLYVDYIGGWKGTYGLVDAPQKVTSSGERMYEIENATGTVTASIAKTDSSGHDIIVSIYKDGKVLTTGTTPAAYGSVKLSVNVDTGTAAPVVTSGSGTATTTKSAVTTSVSNTTTTTNSTSKS